MKYFLIALILVLGCIGAFTQNKKEKTLVDCKPKNHVAPHPGKAATGKACNQFLAYVRARNQLSTDSCSGANDPGCPVGHCKEDVIPGKHLSTERVCKKWADAEEFTQKDSKQESGACQGQGGVEFTVTLIPKGNVSCSCACALYETDTF